MITEDDIDDLLYRRELTPAGARELRKKLRTAPAGRRAKKQQVMPPVPVVEPAEQIDWSKRLKRLREMMEQTGKQLDPSTLIAIGRGERCAFEEFRKANPNHTGPLSLSCRCPKHSLVCAAPPAGWAAQVQREIDAWRKD